MNTKYKYLFLLLIFLINIHILNAQHIHHQIDTTNKTTELEFTVDRPGIADLPYLVGVSSFQIEMGADYLQRGSYSRIQAPAALFRTGISKNAELRIGIRYIVQDSIQDFVPPFNQDKGFSPILIGLKIPFVKENGWIPEIALGTDILLPFFSKEKFKTRYSGHDIFLYMAHNPKSWLCINTNVGAIWEGFSGESVWMYAVCLDFQLAKKVGFFIENYAYIPDESPKEIGLDAGLTYLIRPKMQIDINAGISQLSTGTLYFVGTGLTFRIDKKRKNTKTRF